MFKLAVFTDEVSQDFERAVGLGKEYELEGIEIRSVWDKPPQNLSPEDIDRMKGMLEGTGIRICSIASPFFKCDIDSDEEYRQHLDILRKCIALGKAFDCSIIRGFAFWRKGDAEAVWDRILEKYQEPIKVLEEENVTLALENEGSTFLRTAGDVKKFLDDLKNEHLKAMWDPCNSLYSPEAGEVPYPDGYQTIKDQMVHMHMKDSRVDPETGKRACCVVGEGDIDWVGQFKALIDDGYEGYVSLETHWRAEELTAEEKQRPGGEKFSRGAEVASRMCLDNVKRILASLK